MDILKEFLAGVFLAVVTLLVTVMLLRGTADQVDRRVADRLAQIEDIR